MPTQYATATRGINLPAGLKKGEQLTHLAGLIEDQRAVVNEAISRSGENSGHFLDESITYGAMIDKASNILNSTV